jgi:predicted phage gp36 major capsid-like protein
MAAIAQSGFERRVLGGVDTHKEVHVAAGAANLLVVGDFSNMVIARRTGLSVELVPHLFATANNLPSGQRGLFCYGRIGSNVVNAAGFRLLQNQ